MKIKRFKLSHALMAGVCFGFLMCFSIVGIAIYYQYKTLEFTNRIYDHPLLVIDAARDIRLDARNIFETTKKCADGSITCSDNILSKINKQEKDIETKLQILESKYLGNISDVLKIKQDFLLQKSYTDKTIDFIKKREINLAKVYLLENKYDEFYAKFYNDIDYVLNISRGKATQFLNDAKQNAADVLLRLSILSAINLILGILFLILVIRYIKKEFDILRLYVNDVQNEKFHEIEILDFDSNEFTQLKQAMNAMVVSLSTINLQKEHALKEIQSQTLELFHQKYELDEARLRYQTIFEQSIMAFALINPQTKQFVEFNKATCNILGYSVNELMRIKITDLEAIQNPCFTDDRITLICEHGFDDFETIFIKKDSSLCDVKIMAKIIELHGITFIQLTIRDVTLRKKFYIELLEEKNRFKALFNSSPVALAILNNELSILELNPAFSGYFGYAINEVPNLQTLSKIVFEDEDYRTYAVNAAKISLMEAKDQHGRFVTPTFKIKCKDNQTKHAQISGSILGNGYIMAFNDLTESVNYEKSLRALNEKLANRVEEETKKRMVSEQILRQNEKMAQLGNMIGIILHQWKQPLSSIYLFAQELELSCKTDDIDKHLVYSNVSHILSQVDFMSKTADEFQDFYKPSKEKKDFFVKHQIEIVSSILSKQLLMANITLLIKGDDTLVSKGFDGEFKQVVLNIINNAKDAIIEKKPQNPKIEVNIYEENSSIFIVISDNAGGILPELLPDKIFASFVTTKGDDGTGVGLSLCETIITDRFNGSIFAENIDNGACFTIKLPC